MAFRFLHTSDIHLLDLDGVRPWRYLNKRATGGLNLAVARRRNHRHELFDEIVDHAHALQVDRLVVTGDLTNLALESEFTFVRAKLDALDVPVTVIPGNHDTYTRGSVRARRFENFLMHHMEGERYDGHDYPFVQRFDGVALIGVSSAIASLPLHATGRVGPEQLERLDTMLRVMAEERRKRIVLVHHPVLPGIARVRHDLLDIDAFAEVIRRRGAELVLHGHEHRVIEGDLAGPRGPVPVHGISSGTALSEAPEHRAAFSVYEVDGHGIDRQVYRWTGDGFASAATDHEPAEATG